MRALSEKPSPLSEKYRMLSGYEMNKNLTKFVRFLPEKSLVNQVIF
jgi:hypothetical protein